MHYVLSTSYSFDQVEDSLVAINVETENVIILGDIEQFILKNILIMSEAELVSLAQREYGYNETIETDIHNFIISLAEYKIIELKNDA